MNHSVEWLIGEFLGGNLDSGIEHGHVRDILEFYSVYVVFSEFSKDDETDCLFGLETLVAEVDVVPVSF